MLPGHHKSLKVVEQDRAGKADNRDHEQANVHFFHLEHLPTCPDQVTDTALGSHLLRGDDDQQCHTHTKLDAGYHHWQRSRQRNVAEHHPFASMKVLAHIEVNLIDIAHASYGVDQD